MSTNDSLADLWAAPKREGWLDGKGGNAQRETRWLTPKPLVESLGHFDLDPCGAPGHTLADRTYLIDNGEDGLALPWFGRVWLNPPYGREAEPFLRRLASHGRGTALIFASPETRVFEELVWGSATALLFMQGRINFWDANGVPGKANAGKGSVLVAYGSHDAVALRESGVKGRFIATVDAKAVTS